MRNSLPFVGLILVAWLPTVAIGQSRDQFAVKLHVIDEHGKSLPCRVHLSDAEQKPVKPDNVPFWNDHFVCAGIAQLKLPVGDYRWTIERGPEYRSVSGTLQVSADAQLPIEKTITLRRIASLRNEGWFSGDLHVHRKPQDIPLLMQAEDLDFAPVITWWNTPRKVNQPIPKTRFRFDTHRIYEINAGEDEREGGALLFFGLKTPLDLKAKSREFPSPMQFVHDAHAQDPNVWIDIEKPFWWDVPVWLSSEAMDSIGIANNHMLRSGMYVSEAWGKPRETKQFPAPRGNGFWTQHIYYKILNCGIRVPPSAGSASGVLKNPVGYNRVYTHLPQAKSDAAKFGRETFFDALRQGHSFVTNGPLLRVFANGKPAGTQFDWTDKGVELDLKIQLDSNDHVPKIEIIHNGRVCNTIDCNSYIKGSKHRKPQTETIETKVNFDEPGWFLVRAITDKQNTFRFASTAPFYLGKGAVDRQSAQFFVDWVDQRIARVTKNVRDPNRRKAVLKWHQKAKLFWQKKLAQSQSTAEQ